MPTFLVTGGAGFIGSHLTEELLRKGHRVLVLDDLSSGSIENLSQVRKNPRLEIAVESTSSRGVLAELVDRADVVFHLAATVGVFNIIESPVTTIVNNIGGTETLLKAAAKKKKKVLVASTSEVYGKNSALPFRENYDSVLGASTKSRWSYAASKLVDEFLERRVPDISKVKALTGYTPTVDLRQALSFTRDWLLRQKELDAPVYLNAPLYEGAERIG